MAQENWRLGCIQSLRVALDVSIVRIFFSLCDVVGQVNRFGVVENKVVCRLSQAEFVENEWVVLMQVFFVMNNHKVMSVFVCLFRFLLKLLSEGDLG